MWLWLLVILAIFISLASFMNTALLYFRIHNLKAKLSLFDDLIKENPYVILDRVDVAIDDLQQEKREVDIRKMIHFLQMAYNKSVCDEEVALRIRELEVFIEDHDSFVILDDLKKKVGYKNCPIG